MSRGMYLPTAQKVSLRGCEKTSPLRLSMLRASGKTRKERSNKLPQNALASKDYAKQAH
ncbi:hypothetical protein J2Z48_001353 [Croceifilum oryzae]|uniref:Uncharacterized protein n=1 Tax=Croceifilum oryzae TaxID=1553429 RepID=A0AAJ1TM35_9BACL|nr:hypothetical protein [Croceifilum oryzae]MDQ0417181.1 hypothetical protein [Croceifilum oryzae]